MRITVLYGGPSSEREVSLVSGRAVADGLESMGHDVFGADITPDDLGALDRPADVIFPVLHGAWGESGELQEILEKRGLPFVGSGSNASRIGMDKVETKKAWEKVELPTPAFQVLTSAEFERSKKLSVAAPCVVKAIDSGSSIDVYLCKTDAHAKASCEAVLARHGRVLVEKFIDGVELTCGILEERPLHPIRITTTHEFFDFTAKYKGNDATHHFDLGLPPEVVTRVQALALKAHRTIGCRDLSRVDVMFDKELNPYLLEINTLPGFTPKSLLPEMAAHAGIPFGDLVDRLARRAYARK
jgi:D-alanine-D-alanine ligase